jgi:hypothetical protein
MPAGSTKTGHHLIGDEQDAVTIADLANPLKIAGSCGNRTERRAHHRLGNECGNIVSADLPNRELEVVSAREVTFRAC